MAQLQQLELQKDATATGNGNELKADLGKGITFYIKGTSTPSATVEIQVLTPFNDWVSIDSITVSDTTPIIIQDGDGQYLKVRAKISAYTSGTINVVATLSS